MATNLPPPTGDAGNPPTNVTVWGKLFNWLYLLWQWVTVTLPARLTFGGDTGSYSSAIFASAGQADTGVQTFVGASAYLFVRTQTAQAISTGSETNLTNYSSAIFAPPGAFVASTGTYTVAIPGVYFVSNTVSFSANTNWALTAASASIRINGSNVSDCFERCNLGANNQGVQPPTAVWIGYLNAGDTINAACFQNSGFSQNTEGSHSNYTIVRIAP